MRWWDGQQWTDHVSADASPATSPRQATSTVDGEELAGWGRRLGALVIDTVLTTVVGVLLGLPFWWRIVGFYVDLVRRISASFSAGDSAPASPDSYRALEGAFVGAAAALFVTALVYQVVFLRIGGATPGKRMLGLRVRLADRPGQLPWRAIGLRLAVVQGPALVGLVPFAGILAGAFPYMDGLWALGDRNRRALHDKAAGTQVVRVR